MKYVNRVVGKDGVERLYFRKAGAPSVRLQAAWGSPELEREVAGLLVAATPEPAPATLRAALRAYELQSADFKSLGAGTQYEYRLILKELEEDFGELQVSRFRPDYLLRLRNTWAARGHRAAAMRLLLLRHALLPAIIQGKIGDGDPFTLIPAVPKPRDTGEPHTIWPESVVQIVVEGAVAEGRFGLARGVAIGRYAGARRGDIVKITKAARKAGRFTFRSGKRGVLVDMPEDPALTAVLNNTPAAQDSLILAYNLSGRAYTEDGFGQELAKLLERLEKAGKLENASDYTAHGLRHTFGVEIALAGCTDAQGAALMGHKSPNTFAIYRRQADRIRMATDAAAKVAQFRERTGNADVQNALQNLCKIVPAKAPKGRGKSASKARD